MSLRSITRMTPDSMHWIDTRLVDPQSKILLGLENLPYEPRVLIVGTGRVDATGKLVDRIKELHPDVRVVNTSNPANIVRVFFNDCRRDPKLFTIPLKILVGTTINGGDSRHLTPVGVDKVLKEGVSALQIVNGLAKKYSVPISRYSPQDSVENVARNIYTW